MSDNGPEYFYPWHGTAGPWRGNYFTAWEGSLRAPFLIRWPGKVPAASVSNEIVHVVDLLPTLASVAGYELPDDRIIDGVNQLDFLLARILHQSATGLKGTDRKINGINRILPFSSHSYGYDFRSSPAFSRPCPAPASQILMQYAG